MLVNTNVGIRQANTLRCKHIGTIRSDFAGSPHELQHLFEIVHQGDGQQGCAQALSGRDHRVQPFHWANHAAALVQGQLCVLNIWIYVWEQANLNN